MAKKNEEQVIAELRAHIGRKYRTQSNAAQSLGISEKNLSLMLNQHMTIAKCLLDDAGYKRVEASAHYVRA